MINKEIRCLPNYFCETICAALAFTTVFCLFSCVIRFILKCRKNVEKKDKTAMKKIDDYKRKVVTFCCSVKQHELSRGVA